MNEPKKYLPRLAEKTLETKLNSSGCVLVTGPKFCGKSTLCSRYAKSGIYLKASSTIDLIRSDPKSALSGETPHLIDEWQKVPEIWNLIRADLDEDYEFGKYILTGSTTPVDSSQIQHSGAGRIVSMVLRPFSLYESQESDGLISLSSLFDAKQEGASVFAVETLNSPSLSDIAYLLCRGGWPISLRAKKEYAIETTRNYYDGLFRIEGESDEFASFLKNKDVELLILVLKEFARNISTQAKRTSMVADLLSSGVRKTLTDVTFSTYEKTLKDLFLIYDLPAWNLNLRTSVSVRTAPTHHFVDPSIATACLGISPADLLNDLKSFGFFFEDLAVRDLLVYAESFGGKLKHYRDSAGQEVDAIVERPNGDYGAIEIKIRSEKNIQEAISSLNNFSAKMKANGLREPKFKMALVSHGACYRTEDGVYIVPITHLKP